MRFIRIGDHLVNVANVNFVHFGKGNHVDIVFTDRVISGELSDETISLLHRVSGDQVSNIGDQLTETHAPEVDESPPLTDGVWNDAWNEAIRMTELQKLSYPAWSAQEEFLDKMITYLKSKLVE